MLLPCAALTWLATVGVLCAALAKVKLASEQPAVAAFALEHGPDARVIVEGLVIGSNHIPVGLPVTQGCWHWERYEKLPLHADPAVGGPVHQPEDRQEVVWHARGQPDVAQGAVGPLKGGFIGHAGHVHHRAPSRFDPLWAALKAATVGTLKSAKLSPEPWLDDAIRHLSHVLPGEPHQLKHQLPLHVPA